ESETIQPSGFVVKEACATPSHPRSAMDLAAFLQQHETPALEGADTRALTIRIRSNGTMKAALVPADEEADDVAKEVRAAPHPEARNLVAEVSCRDVERFPGAGNRVIVVDADSHPSEFEVTHVNLNDRTVEGMAHRELPIFSVQYHPEAPPGPWDNEYIFRDFVVEIKGA